LGLAGVILLVLMNTSSLFAGLRNVPYVGRLTTMLESEGGTGQVRVLIWQGASELIAPHQPLNFPDGSQDAANTIRPLVGYGPEAMWIAFNPFYPPALKHAMPARIAHTMRPGIRLSSRASSVSSPIFHSLLASSIGPYAGWACWWIDVIPFSLPSYWP
jgi:hypothetical protein